MRSSAHRVKLNMAANRALNYHSLSPPTRSFMVTFFFPWLSRGTETDVTQCLHVRHRALASW